MVAPFGANEGSERVRNLGDGYLIGAVDMIEGRYEHPPVFRDDPDALGENRPAFVDPVVHGTGYLVFFRVAGHLEPRSQRKNRLRGENGLQPIRQPFLCRRIETVAVKLGGFKPPIMKKRANIACPEVPERSGIAGNSLADTVVGAFGDTLGAKPFPAFANPEAEAVRPSKIVVVASSTRDIPVSRQYLVVKKQLTDPRLIRIERDEIGVLEWSR